jgi:phage tail-like protein
MATQRDNPYGSFNFLVDFATGDATTVRGGFQEVSGMNIEVTSADYRNGNSPNNHPVKVNGVYKVGDVTFKRGLIGSTDLYDWINAIRTGTRQIIPTVTVSLQDEAHEGPKWIWKLLNARPIRYTAPSLNAKTGTDVAIEELVLSIEDLTIE